MIIQESYPVQADDMTAAGDVSARIKRHMKRLGVPAAVMRRVSVCTYEAEINLVIHSDGGQIDFEIAEDRITVRASDIGPGIPDIDLAMSEGYSTATDDVRLMGFGAGMGLANMSRNADRFHIESKVGVGTHIEMRFILGEHIA